MRAASTHVQAVDPRESVELEALMRGVVARERGSVEAFFDRYQVQVNGLVWRMLGADADHDELVNEAFHLMIDRVHQVKNPAALGGWVRAVTVTTVRLALRRRRWRRLFTSASAEPAALSYPDPTVPDEGQRERTRALYRALGTLRVDDRTALVLRHLEGLELTEVADAMGCSLATIKRWLPRAEQRLALKLRGPAS